MNEPTAAEPTVIGLPNDFELTLELAGDLDVDALLQGMSLRHGLFEAATRLARARRAAEERGEEIAANALQLLIIVCQFGYSDQARAPFGRHLAGNFDSGGAWYTPLPEDLSDSHVAVLKILLESIETRSMRAKLADVLWHRCSPRNVEHARTAVNAYLELAQELFDISTWVDSERQFARAFRIAGQLGPQSPELLDALTVARSFLAVLNGADQLYYTQRIVARIIRYIDSTESESLLQRALSISEGAAVARDFDRCRTYYDLAIQLAHSAGRDDAYVKALRITRAETFVTEAACQGAETTRTFYLRCGRQALLDAGAARDRIAAVAQQLDESQRLAPSEMTLITTTHNVGATPDLVRDLVRVSDPIQAMWRLSALPILATASQSREVAEEALGKYVFAFGFGHRHISPDGRQQGTTPGSFGSGDHEGAVRGAMRLNSAHHRIGAVFSAIEPGRLQLRSQHEYTLSEVYDALIDRPLIPHGHLLLFAKGIHAGLVGEFDIAIHILAPQLENALREILRRRGVIVYSTANEGVQSLLPLESIVNNEVMRRILGDDFALAIETTFSERLGANIRNEVAHGIISDTASNSVDTIFGWWLTLRLLGAYGPNPLPQSDTTAPAVDQAPDQRRDPL